MDPYPDVTNHLFPIVDLVDPGALPIGVHAIQLVVEGLLSVAVLCLLSRVAPHLCASCFYVSLLFAFQSCFLR